MSVNQASLHSVYAVIIITVLNNSVRILLFFYPSKSNVDRRKYHSGPRLYECLDVELPW